MLDFEYQPFVAHVKQNYKTVQLIVEMSRELPLRGGVQARINGGVAFHYLIELLA